MVSNIDPTLGGGTTADGRDINKAEIESALTAAKTEIEAQQALTVDFVGDTGSGGTKGLVPAPAAGDSGKFLGGDGNWTTLPGGGDMLSTNNLSDVADAPTAVNNLGLGSASSPQFTAVNIGHATDTTLARSGAGTLTVEGNEIYAAGGTDVPVADGGTGSSTAGGARTNLGAAASGSNSDITELTGLTTDLSIAQGGTGASTASAAFNNLKQSASTSATGVVELATVAETDTGTDTARAVTPDGLAGSNYGETVVQILVFDDETDCATGDGAGDVFFRIPSKLNGFDLVEVAAQCQTAGTTGTMDIQIHNVTDTADMLSTKLTIDTGETDTSTAATAAVIDTANDDVATGDSLRIDVDAVHTTAAKGLLVEMTFRLP